MRRLFENRNSHATFNESRFVPKYGELHKVEIPLILEKTYFDDPNRLKKVQYLLCVTSFKKQAYWNHRQIYATV